MIFWIEAHPGLAAWVQAVFSVIAILAAIGIAVWQRRADRQARILADAENDRRIRSIAAIGAVIALQTIRDTADVAKEMPLPLYREGAVARLQEGIRFFTQVNLTRLTLDEAHFVARVMTACTSSIGILLANVAGDDQMTRLHVSAGLADIRAGVGDIQDVFPDVVQ